MLVMTPDIMVMKYGKPSQKLTTKMTSCQRRVREPGYVLRYDPCRAQESVYGAKLAVEHIAEDEQGDEAGMAQGRM